MSSILRCDRCHIEQTTARTGWATLTLMTDKHQKFDLCPDCLLPVYQMLGQWGDLKRQPKGKAEET